MPHNAAEVSREVFLDLEISISYESQIHFSRIYTSAGPRRTCQSLVSVEIGHQEPKKAKRKSDAKSAHEGVLCKIVEPQYRGYNKKGRIAAGASNSIKSVKGLCDMKLCRVRVIPRQRPM